MWIHVLSTACDVISFNGQGQLCQPTCAEWRDLSNHTRMITIHSRRPKKKAKNHVTLTWTFPWKSCSTTHLPFLSKNFSHQNEAFWMPSKRKKWGKKSQKGGEERKRKVKVKSAVSLFNPKPVSKFYFLHMPELCKLMVCIWIKRLQSVQPVNGFVVSFSSLQQNSDQKTTRLASKHVFQQNLQGQMG